MNLVKLQRTTNGTFFKTRDMFYGDDVLSAVRDGDVVIVDEETGTAYIGCWSDADMDMTKDVERFLGK